MANTIKDLSPSRKSEDELWGDIKNHFDIGFDETENRTTGKNRIGSISFDEADELFRSWINEESWPYDALLFDPRIFTFIFEKTSRLISAKPRGTLTPREGSDVLGAKINNILLDYQWDMANHGGSMISKYAMMDMNTRKYGASFALTKWRYEVDSQGKCVFDGPEMSVINNRDFAHDLTATSIENCNWVQVRQYVTVQDLERINDASSGKPTYKNLDRLKSAVAADNSRTSTGDQRGSNWTSRNRTISKLEIDPYGRDTVYKSIEIVTEYRRDRWITFAPKHGVVLRDIPNPYGNFELPIIMLKYYAIDDDLYGLSEIEPVKGIQKAINALLCQYVDEINQNLYSPIAIGPGVRQHTIEWGKGARWICNNPMSDFRIVEGKSNAAAYFNNTYSALVSAMMNALGESSLGVSNMQPFQNDKTATEVKALQLQRNARDNFNQIFLAEAIKRQLMLWHSMNQKMLFTDPAKTDYLIRVVGKDALDFFQKEGLDAMTLTDEGLAYLRMNNRTDAENMMTPKFPVKVGKEYKPKLQMEESGRSGKLHVTKDDITGMYDFSVDVQTMQANSDDNRREGRQQAVNLITSNPNVVGLLAQEGYQPKFRDLFVQWLEDLGFQDADKYFEKQQKPELGGAPGGPGAGGPPPGGPQLPDELIRAARIPKDVGQPSPNFSPEQGAGIVNQNVLEQAPMSQNFGNPNERMLNELMSQVQNPAQ